jgi:alginate O-acetyltransferase complex protein AlgJ
MERHPVVATLLVVFFVVVIFAPPLKMLLSPTVPWSETEQRTLAKPPQFPSSLRGLSAFFAEVDRYCQDHFGFREFFIYRYFRELKKHFGKAGLDTKVLAGQEGWYFYSGQGEIRDFQGRRSLSEAKLAEWFAERDRRDAWLRSQGITYLLVVPPSKHSIYPEFLPKGAKATKGVSRYEQMLAAAAHRGYLVDLHQPLREAKTTGELYYKKDTHWNLRGGFVSAQTIIAALQERFPEVTFSSDFTFGQERTIACRDSPESCDLARMAMRQEEEEEAYAELKPFPSCVEADDLTIFKFSALSERFDRPSFARRCPKRELTALIFRDSFGVALEPFLSENFRSSVYLWKSYDQVNVEEMLRVNRPDVLIEAIVERDSFSGL